MYKIYKNGLDFINENIDIIKNNPVDLEFHRLNALSINEFSRENYLIKFYDMNHTLLVARKKPFNVVIFGDEKLIEEALDFIIQYNLEFDQVLMNDKFESAFKKAFEKYNKSTINVNINMTSMIMKNIVEINDTHVRKATFDDIESLARLLVQFAKEALNKDRTEEEAIELISKDINFYYVYEIDDKIVSMARMARNSDFLCSVANVYTDKQYRNRGLAYQVVGKLSNDIISLGKVPYLFVDNENPVSNHLYLKLGYTYHANMTEYAVNFNYKTLIVAGGCFWCMAHPYYKYDGVFKVISGYIGGNKTSISYEEVKSGKTNFREAVEIFYNPNKISVYTLLDIYFSSIDPFDMDGQYIDRGLNYTCGIYTLDRDVIDYSRKVLVKFEFDFKRKTYVDILPPMTFYKAEEYHQDYGVKNPELMKEELINSGRLKKNQSQEKVKGEKNA